MNNLKEKKPNGDYLSVGNTSLIFLEKHKNLFNLLFWVAVYCLSHWGGGIIKEKKLSRVIKHKNKQQSDSSANNCYQSMYVISPGVLLTVAFNSRCGQFFDLRFLYEYFGCEGWEIR